MFNPGKKDNGGAVFKALGNPVRREIVRLLSARRLCVNALVARLGVSQAAVSQHLKVLENAGLVRGRKEGCWVHYALLPEGFQGARIFLKQIANEKGGDG